MWQPWVVSRHRVHKNPLNRILRNSKVIDYKFKMVCVRNGRIQYFGLVDVLKLNLVSSVCFLHIAYSGNVLPPRRIALHVCIFVSNFRNPAPWIRNPWKFKLCIFHEESSSLRWSRVDGASSTIGGNMQGIHGTNICRDSVPFRRPWITNNLDVDTAWGDSLKVFLFNKLKIRNI